METGPSEKFSAQALIWNHAFGFVRTTALKCALELGIPEIIHRHGRPISLSELAGSLSIPNINTGNLHRMMRYFVHMGLFTISSAGEEEKYSLTAASKFLVTSEEDNLVPFLRLQILLDAMLMPNTTSSNPLASCLGGHKETAFEKMHGETLWDYVSKRPDMNKLFNEGMACDAKLAICGLINNCDEMFRGIRSLVDVGGGNGTALQAISKAFPHIKCTLLDLPHVIETLPDFPGIDRVAGDMFSFVPHADAVMLMWVLHDWGDDDCIKILKRCKEAILEQGGKVIIIDIVIGMVEETEINYVRSTFDMIMMASTNGKERSEKEWRELLVKAGFSRFKITPIKALKSVIEASP